MGNSLGQALKRCDFGGRALHLFAPFNTFQHLIGIFYRRSNDWLSVFRGFLRFLEGSKTSPIRRTGKQNPLEFSGFYALVLGLEMRLST